MTQRVALVTGGMGGLGTAICKRLAKEGHKVYAGCLPGFAPKDEWLSAIKADGFDIKAAEGDVTDFEACRQMVDGIVADSGQIDILINNAGITRDAQFRKMELSQWLAVINTNLNSAFNVTRHVVDGMVEQGWGRVINMSSVNGTKGQFGQTNYSAAKAGIAGFAKALAQEVVRKGVTVNSISPGYVATDMVMAIKQEVRDQIVAGIPAGRLAKPEEIAGLVAYLVSEDAAYITGANIPINGGMHMYG